MGGKVASSEIVFFEIAVHCIVYKKIPDSFELSPSSCGNLSFRLKLKYEKLHQSTANFPPETLNCYTKLFIAIQQTLRL
jgi:hypothetical protein